MLINLEISFINSVNLVRKVDLALVSNFVSSSTFWKYYQVIIYIFFLIFKEFL